MIIRHILLLSIIGLLVSCSNSTTKEDLPVKTICNPVDLSYRFSLNDSPWREAADPSIIKFNGEYFLFLSKSGGYFHSTDLISWNLISTEDLPIEDYAPTVEEIDGEVYFTTSMGTNRVYKSSDPKSAKWELVTDKFPFVLADPMIFYDREHSRLYLYYGSGAGTPLMGMELDKKTFMPKGDAVSLFYSNREKYGWEVDGDYNDNYKKIPWLEGAWVNKHNGKYYLQYSNPGTQYKSYNDAVYTSDNPLGPFVVAKHNPFAYKPEGFAAGAGHGSTFQDVYGNYWHIGTVTISVRHMFERRLSLFPTFFDKDGELYTYTGWGDYPMIIPNKKVNSPDELFSGWMLLSYNKKIETSSTLERHPDNYAVNEDIRTWWSAKTGEKGEYLSVDLDNISTIHAIQINFADQDAKKKNSDDSTYYQYFIEGSINGDDWNTIIDKSNNQIIAPNEYIQLDKPVEARYVRITNVYSPSEKFSISGFRIFGKSTKNPPAEVNFSNVIRDENNRRTVKLTWDKADNATGYNIRFGADKNKLYHNYIVYDDNKLSVNILNTDLPYFFSIDSFNEGGITKGKDVKKAL